MAFSLRSQALASGNSLHYEQGFRVVIETHLTYLRTHTSTRQEIISADKVHQFLGDFYGLLAEYGVRMDLYWVCLRVNYLDNPNQFGQFLTDPYTKQTSFSLLLPDEAVIGDLRNLYKTTQK